ncbi:MAG: flagellar hook-basal body complex protein FliE [Lachnospiraceae bacterium]|nr:flagellar hook-basal body complex protein FliE [Lachnospiraceae bacterium]
MITTQNIYALGKLNLESVPSITPKSTLTGSLYGSNDATVSGNMFESFLNSAIASVNNTNSYLSDAEDEEIRFALGETESTHDLTVALQKAQTALQYTVSVRDRVIAAYRELMQMQI